MKQTTKVQIYTADEDCAGQRIDNFLFRKFRTIPKTRIYKALRKGEVRVNKKRVSADYKIQLEDVIRIPPLTVITTEIKKPVGNRLQLIENSIIYQDEDFIVLNKPWNIAVHGGSGVDFGVIEGLRQLFPEQKRLELAHRLDKETSGCLIVAKKFQVLRALQQLIREDKVTKHYWALVKGSIRKKQVVDAPLLKNTLSSGERMVRVDANGKPSLTIFYPKQKFAESTLIDVELHTGRTHQIRVHAQYLEHPIVGDEKYGDKEFNKINRQQGLKRLFLHAYKMAFYLPLTEKQYCFEAPLSLELQDYLKTM